MDRKTKTKLRSAWRMGAWRMGARRMGAACASLLLSLTLAGQAAAQGSAQGGAQERWLGGSGVQTRVLRGANGETYLGVWIDAPERAPSAARPPMALSLVIDTSGSMAGDKIENARMAASSVIESLQAGDQLSVYAFSDVVRQISPPTLISPANRGALIQAVRGLYASGATNLYDGLRVGEDTLRTSGQGYALRRLMLISDGQATVGPADPGSMGVIAARGTESGVQISAIGVGLDYDEMTLRAMAVESSGRIYHLEHPAQMSSILEREVGLLGSTVATGVVLEIQAAPGVQLLGLETLVGEVEGRVARIPVGTLTSGQQREVLLRVRVPTDGPAERSMARATLRYVPAGARAPRTEEMDLRYELTASREASEASRSDRIEALVANTQASRAALRAAEMYEQGQAAAAEAEMQRVEEQLATAARRARPGASRAYLEQRRAQFATQRSRARSARSASERRASSLQMSDDALSGFDGL